MDDILKRALNTKKLKSKGFKCEGTISHGEAYDTDLGPVFVKCNNNPQARRMFEGEFEGLEAIAATHTVMVPKPIAVLDHPDGGACLVTEHLEMTVLQHHQAKLGEDIARLHLHNGSLSDIKGSKYVDKFGFQTTTFHRLIPQDNTWKDDWVTFFVENRLDPRFRILEIEKQDREVTELWASLRDRIPHLFNGIEIKPSLLHGDFWGGNVSETWTNPVVFDLASVFYGHHEYDITASKLWGGFTPSFYKAYHRLIPKAAGFESRKKLYQLFLYICHWNRHKDSFRDLAISVMKKLLQSTG